jgi:hypothetical protein
MKVSSNTKMGLLFLCEIVYETRQLWSKTISDNVQLKIACAENDASEQF